MKIAIMQPYFFPYIGYFQLINAVDKFIILDSVQFIRHGWIERNRVLKQVEGWIYIKTPLKKQNRYTLISEREINNDNKWKDKLLEQLKVYKKIAPYYKTTIEILKEILNNHYEFISELNYESLCRICKYIEIETPISFFSEMKLKIDKVNEADEWALNISKSINASEYINPIGGKEFFHKEKFVKNNICLKFLQTSKHVYNQKRIKFEPSLSIIDVMMFNSKTEIQELLNKFELL